MVSCPFCWGGEEGIEGRALGGGLRVAFGVRERARRSSEEEGLEIGVGEVVRLRVVERVRGAK